MVVVHRCRRKSHKINTEQEGVFLCFVFGNTDGMVSQHLVLCRCYGGSGGGGGGQPVPVGRKASGVKKNPTDRQGSQQ